MSFPSDLEISRGARMQPITEIAAGMGLDLDDLELYGPYKAKVRLSALAKLAARPNARYVDVTAITPTPLGEGKTTTTVGIGEGFKHLGKRSVVAIRQPSMGPIFGIKGGAAGGGYSQVVPMEDFNLHLTGDIHAIGAAHNLAAAFLDASLLHGNPLGINPLTITWKRVVDINDRALREIVIGLGGKENGVPRESGFDITVASEVMAILALCTGIHDLRARIGRCVVGQRTDGSLVTLEDLRVAGAMTALLRDAIKPTLMQTLENTPALVHCGPFANIAHGNSSVLADLIGRKCADYLITESGFGADMGLEKFMDIKCRVSGMVPDVAVLVATVRALKMHSGHYRVVAGKPLDPRLDSEDLAALHEGMSNLVAQIENVSRFGVPCVVCINRFPADTPAEVAAIQQASLAAGAVAAVPSTHFVDGGAGAVALCAAIAAAAEQPSRFRFLYELDWPLKRKIEAIATGVYGAADVSYEPAAERKLRLYEERGFGGLPVCMAKTHLSLSHDPKLIGRPTGYTLPIREVNLSAGAGFIYPLCGDMRTMPGLGAHPGGANIDIDAEGNVIGLF
ncbi:MAG: formate--tetrahydrofolate ligase [Chloroflexota bacterium]|nr:formate--tetrahydrofolate ligase [Chloroflexota bacterium]